MTDPFGEALAISRALVPLTVYPIPEPWPVIEEPAPRDDEALGTEENSAVQAGAVG